MTADILPEPGNHWAAAGAPTGSRPEFEAFLASVLDDAKVVLSRNGCDYLRCTVSKYLEIQVINDEENAFSTAYPYLGIPERPQPVILEAIHELEGGYEANLLCSFNGVKFSFFDIDYNLNKKLYETGLEYQFCIAGLAYKVDKFVGDRNLTGNMYDEPLTFNSNASALTPTAEIEKPEYSLKGPVLKQEKSREEKLPMSRFRLITAHPFNPKINEEDDFFIDLFCIDQAIVTRPSLAEGLLATAWLQGRLAAAR